MSCERSDFTEVLTFGFYLHTLLQKILCKRSPITNLTKCNSVINANQRCYLYVINNHRLCLKKCVERHDTEHLISSCFKYTSVKKIR